MTSDARTEGSRGVTRRNHILLLLASVVVIDVIALIVAPPFDPRSRTATLRLPGLLHQRQPGAAGPARRVARRRGRRAGRT